MSRVTSTKACWAKSAKELPKGASQYFTPRRPIKAIVNCMRPGPEDTLCDPACGTGGFLLAAHKYVVRKHGSTLDPDQKRHFRQDFVRGCEIVPATARLCIMNFYLLRITVYDVLEYLASGMTEAEILADVPDLELEDIRAALAFAAERERRLVSIPPG